MIGIEMKLLCNRIALVAPNVATAKICVAANFDLAVLLNEGY